MSGHTPGPWIQDIYGNINDKTGNIIRVKGLALTSGSEAKANARLIAAAPDLLEALQALDLLFSPLAKDSTASVWIDKARAAIAKATGGEA